MLQHSQMKFILQMCDPLVRSCALFCSINAPPSHLDLQLGSSISDLSFIVANRYLIMVWCAIEEHGASGQLAAKGGHFGKFPFFGHSYNP
jgi:hypothetical protein